MKGKHVFLIILVLTVIGGLLSLLFLSQRPTVGMFSLTKYQWEIQTFSLDKNVGEITDKNVAVKKAKLLWLEKYNIDVAEKKIKVAYDYNEECWHVYNTVSPNTLGGVFHAIIQKKGLVLAVWCED